MSDMQNDPVRNDGAPASAKTNPLADAPVWRATPELDVFESASEFLILLNVPGATPDSVDVQVLGSELHVRAEQAPASGFPDVARARFERHLELPSELDASSATAKLRDGVLAIQIQKSAGARRVKIPVNAN